MSCYGTAHHVIHAINFEVNLKYETGESVLHLLLIVPRL